MSQYDAGIYDPASHSGGEPPRTSLLCVSALVSSVIFCCPLTSLLGLLLGIAGMVSVSSSNGRRKGTGLAFAAIVIAILSLIGQAAAVKVFAPYLRNWARTGIFLATGPTPFLKDLQVGDLVSARTYLHPDADAAISDAQLQGFADEITKRYGNVIEWVPAPNPPFNPSGPGEATFSIPGQLRFTNATCSATMDLTVYINTTGNPEVSGISKLVIQDTTLGDLVLDENAPAGEDGGG